MKNRNLIVVQGGLYDDLVVENIKNCYSSVKEDVVISTWKDEDDHLKNKLLSAGFNLILSEYPKERGVNNFNLQSKSASAGISPFVRSEYTHVLKIRTDMVPSCINSMLRVLESKSLEKIVFLCWLTYEVQYVTDYISFGPIEDSLRLWNIYQTPDEMHIFPERLITYKYTGMMNPDFEKVSKYYDFCINQLYNRSIRLIRTKANTYRMNLDQIHTHLNINKDALIEY